ncbi:hypothetical protein ABPG74_019296 [Tetrahymena malaccensis]
MFFSILSIGQTIDECNIQSGFYFDTQQNSCNQCSIECYTCFGESQCSQCQKSSYLSQKSGKCLDTCPDGTFQSLFFNYCQECLVENCQKCSSPNTCVICQHGWTLSQDHKSCLQDLCFQNQDYVYDPNLQKCVTYCPQNEDKSTRVCSSYFQIGDIQQSIIPSNLYNNCVLVKLITFWIKQKQQIAALCLDQVILFSYDELQPFYAFQISGTIQDAIYFDDVIFILVNSNTSQTVTFDIQNVSIEYFDTLNQCDNKIYNNQYLFCQSEFNIEPNIFTMVDIFTQKSYQFQSDFSNVEVINSLQQSPLNNHRLLKKNNTLLSRDEKRTKKRNLQDDSINYEPEPYNQNTQLITIQIPLIQVLPDEQISVEQSYYYYKLFQQINKVISYSSIDQNFYYFDLSKLNQPLLAANIPNSGNIICESVYNDNPIFIISQQQEHQYSYFTSVRFNVTSGKFYCNINPKANILSYRTLQNIITFNTQTQMSFTVTCRSDISCSSNQGGQYSIFMSNSGNLAKLDLSTFNLTQINYSSGSYITIIQEQLNAIQGYKKNDSVYAFLSINNKAILLCETKFYIIDMSSCTSNIVNLVDINTFGSVYGIESNIILDTQNDLLYILIGFNLNVFQFSNFIDEQSVFNDFTIITKFNLPILFYSSDYVAYAYDLKNSVIVSYIQNASQKSCKFQYDEEYLYSIGVASNFDNLIQPELLSFSYVANQNDQSILKSINIQILSQDSLFTLSSQNLENNLDQNKESSQVKVIFTDSTIYYFKQSQIQQKNAVSSSKQVGNYIISIQRQQQDLVIPSIPLFVDFILPTTLIQYSTQEEGNDGNQVYQNLIIEDFNFLFPVIQDINLQKKIYTVQRLAFIKVNLLLNLTSSNSELNNQGLLNELILDQVNLIFFNTTPPIKINNCPKITIQQINILSQNLNRTEPGLIIQNSQNIVIEEFNIRSSSYNNKNNTDLSGLIVFSNITNIYINSFSVQNVQLLGQIFQIFSSTSVTIKNLTISDSKLSQFNIVEIQKSQNLFIDNFIAQNICLIDQKYTIIDQNKLFSYMIYIQGTYKSIFNKVNILNFTNVGVIKTENYYNNDATLSYNYLIDFNFLNITNIQNDYDFNSSSILIYIQAINSNFQNVDCQQVILSDAFINVQSINQTQITNSKFSKFEFINQNFGGILNLSGKNFVLENVIFQDCLSKGISNAINVIQSSSILVQNCKFIDLQCYQSIKNTNSNSCQSGAIYLSQVRQAEFRDSLFVNCSSSSSGGALYANNFNTQGSISIISCVFEKCQSLYKSGGALFVQDTFNFTIIMSILQFNKAQSERGGAIAIQTTNLYVFQATKFEENYSQIGGSIWYDQFSSIKISQDSKFIKNNAICYGKNIGSYPRSIQRVDSQNRIIEDYVISQISSGNQLPYKQYFNLFDEENNPIKCFDINDQLNNTSPDLIKEFDMYNLQIELKSNKDVAIKQQQVLIKNNILQLFEFDPILIYRGSQTQSINLVSNSFLTTDQNNGPLNLQLVLHFRDCQRGEIIQVQNEFITCYVCPQDRYSVITPNMVTDQNQLSCQKCPTQALNCSGSSIILRDGFWRPNKYSDNIYPCYSQGCKEYDTNSKFGCSIGYVGPLCDSCDSKAEVWQEIYSRDSNLVCKTCKSLQYQYLYFAIVFICYILYITYSINNQFDKKILLFILDLLTQSDILITSQTRSQCNDIFLKIKIFINYFQVLQIFFIFVSVPIQLQYFIDVFGHPVRMTISSFDCFFKMKDHFPLWPSLSKLLISGLFCKQIEQKYYLISQLDYECYTNTHIAYIFGLLIPLIIVWCLLIPFYYYIKLKSIQKQDKKTNNYLQILIYGVLYKSYKVDYSYWEIPYQNTQFYQCEKSLNTKLNVTFLLLNIINIDGQSNFFYQLTGYFVIVLLNIQAVGYLIIILLNRFEIKIHSDSEPKNLFAYHLLKLKQKFPKILGFVYIKKIDLIRVSKLWKKVISDHKIQKINSKNIQLQRNKEQTLIRSTNVTNISHPRQISFFKKQVSHQERLSIYHNSSFDFYSINQEYAKSNSPQLLMNDQQQFLFDSTLIQESDQQVSLPQPFKRSFFSDKNNSPTKFFQPK